MLEIRCLYGNSAEKYSEIKNVRCHSKSKIQKNEKV